MAGYSRRKPNQLSAAQAAAAGRAHVGAGQADPPEDADRAREDPGAGRRDLHHGHPRPGRGHDHGAPPGRHDRRPDRPVRHAAGRLRVPEFPLRGQLHRVDQHVHRHHRRR
ncbi:hypothetical protein G6F62_015043 [Rhizopus arrhizus]|nr:hypothetical protein G6F62_015043 [Rhizopus arrhizus]